MKYILFLFVKHENQDEFLDILSETIISNLKTHYIKYFFGDESATFTFKTDCNFKTVSEEIKVILGVNVIPYFLLPYTDDNISVDMDKETKEHLFGFVLNQEIPNEEDLSQVEPELFRNFDKTLEQLREQIDEMEYDEDEILTISLKPKQKTLDEILDQINDKGFESLTQKDKTLLENYSKR